MFNKKKQKKMKKSILTIRKAIVLAMCVTFALAFFNGCSKDGEEGGGKGDPREGYLGTWRVTERIVGLADIDYYNVTITKSSIDNKDIVITNFFNEPSVSLLAKVDGNSFTIPQQTFSILGFSGSGRRDGNSLTFSVMANMTGGVTLNLECTANKL
jgi:hypothetical protein